MGAGKTQLCRRLRGLPYDASVPTTHGIQLSETTLELEGIESPIQLNLWDFGGQEVYHGSHALFLQGQAVFLVFWTPERENSTPYQEGSLSLRHRPLPYWLDYLRAFAGVHSPVLLIQSRCDSPAQRVRPLPVSADDFMALQPMPVSAKTGLGLDAVRAGLKEAVRDCLHRRPAFPIGHGRVRVRNRLRELLATGGHRWLERAKFDRLCEEAGGISNTEALLDFLHHSGVVFCQAGLFDGRIILDQNWALEAIYALFDRKKALPLLRSYGRFRRADLEALAWPSYAPEEQKVFLGMMESCGVCFRVRELPDNEWEYLAPELLPPWSEAQESLLAGRLLQSPPVAHAEARYPFLHEGVLRNYLSRIGQRREMPPFTGSTVAGFMKRPRTGIRIPAADRGRHAPQLLVRDTEQIIERLLLGRSIRLLTPRFTCDIPVVEYNCEQSQSKAFRQWPQSSCSSAGCVSL